MQRLIASDPVAESLHGLLDLGFKESFRTLPSTASLADAKHFMDTIPGLSDVFVTADGTKQAKVTGWVTDGKVLDKSRA